MANRFPLVLDTDAGNKIKELPSGDNLNLRESSIVNVQDITALGTINAADIRVNGNRLVAQSFADLTDTPNTFAGAANYFVKVKEDGTGLEFRPFSDIGNIEVEQIEVTDIVLPTVDNTVDIGSALLRFRTITAVEFKGDLLANDESKVFDAATGFISYAALQGAPQFLSEFTDDIGFLRTSDLDDALAGLFDDGIPFVSDIKGSVFADDSTLLVDSTSGKIVGEVDTFVINTSVLTSQEGLGNITITGGPNTFGGNVNIVGGTGTFEQGGTVNINGGNGQTVEGFVNIGQSSSEVRIDGNDLFIGTVVGNINLGRTGSTTTAFGVVDFTSATVTGSFNGEMIGSVYYDDSTQIIDAVAGRIVSPVVRGQALFENNVTVDQDLVVLGNLIIQGTTTSIETTNTTITDNIIVLNEGEIGSGVTSGTSGIEIDRGSLTNVTFLWNETTDKWTIGSQTLVAATFEGNLSGNVTGNVTGNTNGTHTGAVIGNVTGNLTGNVTGNVTGDIVGSVFGDDSSIIVDAINRYLVADKVISPVIQSTDLQIISTGTTTSQALSYNFTANGGQLELLSNNNSVVMSGVNNYGSISYNDSNGNISIGTTGTIAIQGAAGSAVSIGGGTSGSITLGNGTNSVGFTSGTTINFLGATVSNFAGNVTGNITNTNLTVGANATNITIGNATSTIEINGIIEFADALIANNITSDDSIIIRTLGNTANEAITIRAFGTNNAVNLTADNIRFFGPITTNIEAVGGISGDLNGSVFADDSTLLVDALNGVIPYTVLDGAPTALSDFSNDLDYTGIVGVTIQTNGLPVNTFMTGDLDAQGNNIENANLISATGDLQGSIFADDSSIMVDAVNFTMFADAMTLTPLSAEPAELVAGMLVAADGVSWDPASKAGAVPYPVFYDGVAWNSLY